MDCLYRTSAPILHGSSPRLTASRRSPKFQIPRLKAPLTRKRLVLCRASGSDERDAGNDFPFKTGKAFVEEANTRHLKLDAWRQLASEEGREIPTAGHVHRIIVNTAADYVLQKVLCWEKEENILEKLKSRLSQLYFQNLLKLDTPVEGLREWLEALYTAGTPCAIVSCLDRKIMLEALEQMGISKYFQAVVSEEDGMESMAHGFLAAAVKLDRKPSKCVVFEDDPRGITAAHNCTMMAVAMIGAHPAYELEQADLAVASYNELSVINLRRLFAHKGSSFMDLRKQIIEKLPSRRKLTTDTIF